MTVDLKKIKPTREIQMYLHLSSFIFNKESISAFISTKGNVSP